MAHRALAHRTTDDVAVAVADLRAGEILEIQTLDGGKPHKVKLLEDVPLGHKVALKDLPEGHVVIEYGEKVGRITQAVRKGSYVHVHNLRTLRWDYGEPPRGAASLLGLRPARRVQNQGSRVKKGGK